MGHSQSYDLRNPETGEKTPVRGVRRVSREHQTDAQFSAESAEPFDYREEELRERIRREQLRKREDELESLRIRQHESREPIIDAYRQNQTPPQATIYKEFNHYDSLKHPSPVDPNTYFTLNRRAEVNEGRQFSIPIAKTRYDQVPSDPSPELPRRHEIPIQHSSESSEVPSDYPHRSSVFAGRLSPLPRQPEVDPHPMPRYIPPMSPRYDRIPNGETYSKTTTVTTYTISRGDMSKYDEVPSVPVSTSTYSKASKLPKYSEAPKSKTYSRGSELSRYKEINVNTTGHNTYSRASTNLPKYDEVPGSKTYSRASKISRYDEVPHSPIPRSTTYSKASELSRYDEVPRSPIPRSTTYSRASELLRYDEVPRSPIPRSSSVHSLYSRTSRVPTYDEVPIQRSPRSITPIYVPRESKSTNRVRIVPVQTSPPVPKPNIHLTPLQPEVSRIPLEQSVSRSVYRNHVVPVKVESRSDSPAYVVIPFSSNSRSKTPSPSVTPVPRTYVKPPRPSKVHQTPLQSEVSRVPLDHYVDRRRRTSMDKITMTKIYRTNVTERRKSTPIDPIPSPRRVSSSKIYLTPLQKEVPEIPLSRCVSRPTVPRYSSPPSETDSSSGTIIYSFSKKPSPPRSPRRVSPIYSTPLQQDLQEVPLERYEYSTPIYSNPSTIVSPVPSSIPSPTRTPSPKLYLTTLEREVPGTPLERYVNRRPIYSTPPLEDNVTRTVITPVNRTPSPPSHRMPPKLHVTPLHKDVPQTPLYHYVSRTPFYSTPSVEDEPTVTHTVVRRTPPSTPPKIYLTRLQPEVPKTPLYDYVARPTPIYSTPPSEETVILTPHRMPPKLHQTRLQREVPGTPLGHYVSRTPYYSIPPFDDESTVTHTRSIPVSARSTPSPYMPPKMHLTRRHPEVPSRPLEHFVTRPKTPPTVILVDDSLSEEKPESSSDCYPKTYTKVMPDRRHVTHLEQEVPVVPFITSPRTPNVVVEVFDRTSTIGTQTLGHTAVLQPKVHLTSLEKEVTRVPFQPAYPVYYSKPVYNRASTIISIYSNPIVESPTHVSELHAEKRMIVGLDEMEKPNVTYVTVATSSIDHEQLHRHPEVGRHPVYVLPSQSSYETTPIRVNKQTQYSRRPSDDYAKILVPPQKCNVENCTHVEVNDTPVASRRRISQDSMKDKENRINIFVNENDLENVVELAGESDNHDKKCSEEKLYYNSYMPTLSLRRRPVASSYDKLH